MAAKMKLGYKVLAGIIGIALIAAVLYGTSSLRNEPANAALDRAVKLAIAATGDQANQITIKPVKKADFGANWPFIPDSGLLVVTKAGGVYFMENSLVYAVNGTARKGVNENPQLLDLPFSVSHRKEVNKDSYVDLAEINHYGLSLIGVYAPKTSYFAPEPKKEPDVKYGFPEAQRRQIFQEQWDSQYITKLGIAKLFPYQEYGAQQKSLEAAKFREIDKKIVKKYSLSEENYRKISTEGLQRGWNTGRKSFSYSWQLVNKFPE